MEPVPETLRPISQNYSGDSRANIALARFPQYINGAAGIVKYAAPKASHCLVHIRQLHDHENKTESDKVLIEACQGEVYSILSFLIDNYGMREVRVEGITAGMEPWEQLLGQWEHQRRITGLTAVQLVEREMKALATPEDPVVKDSFLYERSDVQYVAQRLAILESQLDFAQMAGERLLEERRSFINAAYRLNAEGRLRIRAAEDDELYALADDAIEGGADPKQYYEQREDKLLEMIATSAEFLSFAVFGGHHD